MRRTARRFALTAAAVVALLAPVGATATAAPSQDPGWLADRLEHGVGDGGYRHLVAWQHAADQGGGTRSVDTDGFRRSADYLVRQLRGAGYRVTRQVVPFQRYRIDTEHAELTATGEPVRVLMSPWGMGTPQGGVTAPVVALPDTRDGQPVPDAGCSADDYDGLPVAGAIVVAPRPSCGLVEQQTVAAELGARAVLSYLVTPSADNIYRTRVFTPEQVHIPMGMVSQRVGERLAAAEPGSVSLHLEMRATVVDATTENILAQTAGGRTDRVVMAGAHLDSVPEGPGIDDNASSAAAMLQIALRLAPYQHQVTNAVRFAWWGAEEEIVVGSGHYVDSLDQGQRDDIALYLNAELIAAPNFARFVIDGDDSDHPGTGSGPAPAGSGAVEAVLAGYYTSRHLAYETQDLSNIGSDHEPFAAAGIPIGGIDGGATQLKTAVQAERYGGQAGQMFDSCYHQSCDDLANVDRPELARNARALAFTVGRFALNVGDVTASRSATPPRPTADDTRHTGTRGTPPTGRTAHRSGPREVNVMRYNH